jgi:hypothetical protein
MSEAFSGKSGTAKVNDEDVAEVTAWSFEPTANIEKYASNATSGHKKGVACVEDFSGSITTKLDANGNMPFRIGDTATVELHVDDTNENYIEAPIIIGTHPIPCDINDGKIVEVQYGFEPTGAPSYNGILAVAGGSS